VPVMRQPSKTMHRSLVDHVNSICVSYCQPPLHCISSGTCGLRGLGIVARSCCICPCRACRDPCGRGRGPCASDPSSCQFGKIRPCKKVENTMVPSMVAVGQAVERDGSTGHRRRITLRGRDRGRERRYGSVSTASLPLHILHAP
jgi:hypothetical protein